MCWKGNVKVVREGESTRGKVVKVVEQLKGG